MVTQTRSSSSFSGPISSDPFPRRKRTRRQQRRLIIGSLLVVILLCLTYILYAFGPLNPSPRSSTVTALPPLSGSAVYNHLTRDTGGWLWVSQSQSGKAGAADDPTLLTVVNPQPFWGQPAVQFRLCIGGSCAQSGTPTPALTRIDALAYDPNAPHSIYIAGWAGADPLVVRATLPSNPSVCAQKPGCANVVVWLDRQTPVTRKADGKIKPVLGDLIAIGADPLMSLAIARNGDVLLFLSDEGKPDLADVGTNIIGGYQGLLVWNARTASWSEQYVGPSGTFSNQALSPTATVTAIALDTANTSLYLADSAYHTLLRLPLDDAASISANPYLAVHGITTLLGTSVPDRSTDVSPYQALTGGQDTSKGSTPELGIVRGLAVDDQGTLILADALYGRLRAYAGGKLVTIAGGSASDGSNDTPKGADLRGIMDVVSDQHGGVYALQIDPSSTKEANILAFTWGWSHARDNAYTLTNATPVALGTAYAGLQPHGLRQVTIDLLDRAACSGQNQQSGCLLPVQVAAGGWAPGQLTNAPPSLLQAPLAVAGPVLIEAVPAQGWTAVLTDTHVLLVPPDHTLTSAPPQIGLPADFHPSHIGFFLPDARQATGMPQGMIIVAGTQGTTTSILRYAVTLTSCNTGASTCTITATLTPLAQVSLAGSASSVATAYSQDGEHGIGLIGQSQQNRVAFIDLQAGIVTGTIASTGVSAIVTRHDGQAAYLARSDGKIGTISIGLLLSGVQNASVSEQDITVGPSDAPVVALALAPQDERLTAIVHGPSQTALVQMNSGAFGAPVPLHVTSSSGIERETTVVAYTATGEQLLTLVHGKTSLVHSWMPHNEIHPAQWLDAPLSIGTLPVNPSIIGFGASRAGFARDQ